MALFRPIRWVVNAFLMAEEAASMTEVAQCIIAGARASSSGPMLGKRIPVYSEFLKVFSLNSASIYMFEHVPKDNLNIYKPMW